MPTAKDDLMQFINDLRRTSNDPQTRRRCHDRILKAGRTDLFEDEEQRVQEKRPSATHPPRRDV